MSLSSLVRLSSALQSLLWTSKVPKKSNMSNKSGFTSWVYFHCRDFMVVKQRYVSVSFSGATAKGMLGREITNLEIRNLCDALLSGGLLIFPALFVLTGIKVFSIT